MHVIYVLTLHEHRFSRVEAEAGLDLGPNPGNFSCIDSIVVMELDEKAATG